MNKNTIFNVFLAVSSALLVFVLMLFIYANIKTGSTFNEIKKYESTANLEYSFTNIAANEATFNIADNLLSLSPILSCSDKAETIITKPITVLSGLTPGEKYSCILTIEDTSYNLIEFSTLKNLNLAEYGLTAYQSYDDNNGRIIRIKWELEGESLITKSVLSDDGLLLNQYEYLVSNDNFTDRLAASEADAKIQYELRSFSNPKEFAAVRLEVSDNGTLTYDPSLKSLRIGDRNFEVSDAIVSTKLTKDSLIFEKINGMFILQNTINSLIPKYVLTEMDGTTLQRIYPEGSAPYLLTSVSLNGFLLTVEGKFFSDSYIYLKNSIGEVTKAKMENNSITLKDAPSILYVYNGVDRYIKVQQSYTDFRYNWDSKVNRIDWDSIPGAIGYLLKVYGPSENLLYQASTSSASHSLYSLDYQDNIRIEIGYITREGIYNLGNANVKLDPANSRVPNVSLAKLDNMLSITWTADSRFSYKVEIAPSKSEKWNVLSETELGVGEISVKSISKLPSGSYQIRISPTISGKTGAPTSSSCIIEVAVDKTFRIVCQ